MCCLDILVWCKKYVEFVIKSLYYYYVMAKVVPNQL